MVRARARIGFLLLAATVFPHSRAAAQQSRSSEPPHTIKVSGNSVIVPGIDTDFRDHTDAPKCDLPAVLAQAGARANELVTNIQNFTAQERIEFRILDRIGNQYDSGSDDFDYTAVLIRQPQGYTVHESRNPVPGSRPFPIATHDLGLPEIALMFLPEFQTNFEITCSGAVMRNERLTWMINLHQRKDHPDTTASFTAKNGVVYPAPLKGRAWIAKDSGEVIHLEVALMHPILPANIQSWSLSINYAPVHFRTRNIDVWLPQSAEVYRESENGRTFTSHKFTDFRLFSVDVDVEPNSPPSR
jgi:hypothetical protein